MEEIERRRALPIMVQAEVWMVPDSVSTCLVLAEVWDSEWYKEGFRPKEGEVYKIIILEKRC